ncbi:MAG: hypothetical protein ACO1OB_11885 [Archangium sp.]
MIRSIALVVSLFSITAFAQDEEDPFVKAKTLDACRKIYATEGAGLPAAGMRWMSSQFAACTKRVMNVEVDRVLVPLKKTNTTKFKDGMAMQKLFNEAVQRYCGRWSPYYEKCCSTCSYNEQPECEADFHTARVKMSKETLPEAGKVAEPIGKEFTEFANAFCAFTERKDDCATRVLTLITVTQKDDGKALGCR